MTGRSDRDVWVEICPDGPLLLRGAETVQDSTGVTHQVTRPVAALCLCERSQRSPWCDGTHKFLNRPDDGGV